MQKQSFGHPSYPRTERVSAEVQRVLARTIERLYEPPKAEDVATVTAVSVDPDLRRARVYLDHISETLERWLEENRGRLQSEIGRQVRMKRTPQLEFTADPAILAGTKIEAIIRSLHDEESEAGQD